MNQGFTGWPTPTVIGLGSGSLWSRINSLVPLGQPPSNGPFTWVNQGTATVADLTGGGFYMSTVANASNDIKMLVRTLPATPFTVTAGWLLHSTGASNGEAGIVIRNSSSGAIATHTPLRPGGVQSYVSHTSPTATGVNVAVGTSNESDAYWLASLILARVTDDGTTRLFQVSKDGGDHWVAFFSESHTATLTPDQIGIALNSVSTSTLAVSVLLWSGA